MSQSLRSYKQIFLVVQCGKCSLFKIRKHCWDPQYVVLSEWIFCAYVHMMNSPPLASNPNLETLLTFFSCLFYGHFLHNFLALLFLALPLVFSLFSLAFSSSFSISLNISFYLNIYLSHSISLSFSLIDRSFSPFLLLSLFIPRYSLLRSLSLSFSFSLFLSFSLSCYPFFLFFFPFFSCLSLSLAFKIFSVSVSRFPLIPCGPTLVLSTFCVSDLFVYAYKCVYITRILKAPFSHLPSPTLVL